jgi:hypothetical protein
MLLLCGLIAAASRTEPFTNPQNSYRLSWPNSFSEKKRAESLGFDPFANSERG